MSSKADVTAAINARVAGVGASFGAWQIGITNDPSERKAYWSGGSENKFVGCWTQWEADSLQDAQEIENYFINTKGMKGGVGGSTSARYKVYVYIF